MHGLIRVLIALLVTVPSCAGSPSPEWEAAANRGAQQHAAADITAPEEHLGRPLGIDFQLADWEEVSSWYLKIAEESPRVVTERIGTTTEGRDFLISIISSEENLANLDEIKAHAATLADPRGKTDEEKQAAIELGRVILLISPQMHSTEAGGAEAAMQFAHLLVTSEDEPWKSARDNLVVGIFPCTNPDGLDHVVHWYREHVGTPYEATGMLRLYQYYSGHDNNRDWFMLTQNETRIVTEQLYNVWHPQVYWDVHQQGSRGERMFVPPFRDPLNPNLDPAIISGIDAIGSRALLDMTRDGLTGVSTGVTYDMWWTGGNRNVPVRHNIIGLLTEAASVDLATPVFLPRPELRPPGHLPGYWPSNQFPAPWPGGWWRIGDIVQYQVAFGISLLGSLAREREFWLRNALQAAERTIEKGQESGPRAWIIPSDNRDPDAVRRLVDVLLRTGIEIHISPEEIEADGRTYPAGSIVILRDQPYGNHVKDLLEVQRYPEGAPPYDVAGWTLPYLLGVRRVEVMQPVDTDLERASSVNDAMQSFPGSTEPDEDPIGPPVSHSSTWSNVFDRLEAGERLLFVTRGGGDDNAWFVSWDYPVDNVTVHFRLVRLPRIGLYAPWFGSMDEGWMRWVLDHFEIPYLSVRNEQIRAGQLNDLLDVLIIPDVRPQQLDEGREEGTIPDEYARGLAPEGAVAVEEFVRRGGKLITLDSSSQWAIDLFQFPLVDVTREDENRGFSCPGSVLRAIPEDHPINAGLPASIGLFFSRSAAWREMTEDERKEHEIAQREMTTLLRYAPTRVLLSGWIEQSEVIEGRSAWVTAPHGKGSVHLFAFRPQYRGWTQATFPLIFRAILLEN